MERRESYVMDDDELDEGPSQRKPSKRNRRASQRAEDAADDAAAEKGAGAGASASQQQPQRRQQQQRDGGGGGRGGFGGGAVFTPRDTTKYNRMEADYREEVNKKKGEMPDQLPSVVNLDSLVGIVARIMLFSNFEKTGAPVMRTKLVEAVAAQYKGVNVTKKLPSYAIALAQLRLLTSMGMEMRELERPSAADAAAKRKPGDDGGAGGAKQVEYFLRTALPSAVAQEFVDTGAQNQSMGLSMLVLSFIYLSQNKSMDEGEIWRLLGKLGLEKDKDHPVFGKPAEELAKMESLRYVIKYKKAGGIQTDGAGPEHVFEWGENATDLIGERGIKTFIDGEFRAHQERLHRVGAAGNGREEEVICISD